MKLNRTFSLLQSRPGLKLFGLNATSLGAEGYVAIRIEIRR